jgi:hypothetical protein
VWAVYGGGLKIALEYVCILLPYPYPHRFGLVVGNYVENFVLIYFVRNADTAIGFSLHLYLLRISLTANQLSQPPVIYRTFLFLENHPPVSRYILGFTGA